VSGKFLSDQANNIWIMEQIELSSMMDMVQETERKMIEMSALNHLFSTYVLRQAQQIEMIYTQVLLFFLLLVHVLIWILLL
jgi:hypothetical protein